MWLSGYIDHKSAQSQFSAYKIYILQKLIIPELLHAVILDTFIPKKSLKNEKNERGWKSYHKITFSDWTLRSVVSQIF